MERNSRPKAAAHPAQHPAPVPAAVHTPMQMEHLQCSRMDPRSSATLSLHPHGRGKGTLAWVHSGGWGGRRREGRRCSGWAQRQAGQQRTQGVAPGRHSRWALQTVARMGWRCWPLCQEGRLRALFEPPRPPTAAAVQSAAGTLQCLACDGEGRTTLHSAGTGRDEGGTREVATSSKNSRTAPAGGWRGPRAARHFFVTHAGSAKRRANQATRPPESTVRSTGLVLLLLTARPGTASEQGRGAAEGYSSSECGISALPESSRRSEERRWRRCALATPNNVCSLQFARIPCTP